MRAVPEALQAHLNQPDTTTTRLLRIILRTGFTYGLAMLDRDVVYDDGDGPLTYVATNGFDPSTLSADTGFSVSNAEGYSLISNEVPGVTVAMVEAGEFDDARWICYLVNYEDLSMGHLILDAGDIGEVRTQFGMVWIPELLSYIMRLRQTVGSVWSRKCRAIFGSPRNSHTGCGVNLSPLWVDGSVASVGDEIDRIFTGSAVTAPSGIVPEPGRVKWLTGANAGREFSVEEVDGNVVTLYEPTPYPIAVGDTYRIRPDCKKRYIEDCIGVWDNGINFKGEPLIPVGDASSIQSPGGQLPGGGAFTGDQEPSPPVLIDPDSSSGEPQPTPPPSSSDSEWWPNWPIMNCTCLQGNSSTTILDATQYELLADKDLIIIQTFYPTTSRLQSRTEALRAIKAIRAGVKFVIYVMAQETLKSDPAVPGNDAREVSRNLIISPTDGNPNWFVHRVGQPGDAGRVECNFDPVNAFQCNMAALVAGNNSYGETYAKAFWKKWKTLLDDATWNLLNELSGFFMDNFNQRPPAMFQGNGTITITDQDYNADGVVDGRADYSSGSHAGGRFWAEGHLAFKTEMEARFPGFLLVPNAARFDLDYLDGEGSPPVPLPSAPFYRQFDAQLRESIDLVAGMNKGSSSYTFTGGGSLSAIFRYYNIQERFLRLDADNTATGKSAVLFHANTVDRASTADDYAYARFFSACALLIDRGAPCVQRSGARALSLDECLLELGNPVAIRSMGTLNETTIKFTIRTADQTVGVGKLYWAIFEKGGVFVRGDSPTVGTWPSADAAVTFTLPTPPTGKKWQMPNSATYVNPLTGRAMRGQNTTINNGADVTTISLKPYHAVFVRLVDA